MARSREDGHGEGLLDRSVTGGRTHQLPDLLPGWEGSEEYLPHSLSQTLISYASHWPTLLEAAEHWIQVMTCREVHLPGWSVMMEKRRQWLERPQCITSTLVSVGSALLHTLDLFNVLNRHIVPQDINVTYSEPSDFVSQIWASLGMNHPFTWVLDICSCIWCVNSRISHWGNWALAVSFLKS